MNIYFAVCWGGSSYLFLVRSRKFSEGTQHQTTDRGRHPLRMLGLEGLSKRSLSESKKKSKELDSVAKFHIYMCIRLCSTGLYGAVARIKASVQTLVQSAGTGAQPFTQQYDNLWGVRVTQRVTLRPLISRGYRGAIDIKWSKTQANQLSQE